jgi:hypothetical protein
MVRTVFFSGPAAAFRAMSKVRDIAHILVWDMHVTRVGWGAHLSIPADLIRDHPEITAMVQAEGGRPDWIPASVTRQSEGRGQIPPRMNR